MRTFDGKVVVITGAGSGIGRALALDIAARGAVLAVSDQDEVGLVETAERARTLTDREVRIDKLDVRDTAAMHEYAGSVASEQGRVNALFNNAGVALHGDFEEVSYEDFAWVMDVNFWGVVRGTKEFLPHLIASGDGAVVNISSLFGLISMPGQTAYNATKYAVRGFTEALREEMLVNRQPVTVTCVHPGGIKTGISRNGRKTTGQDAAAIDRLFDEKLARMPADKAARIILDAAVAGKARQLVGLDAHLLHHLAKLSGSRYQDVVARFAGRVIPHKKA